MIEAKLIGSRSRAVDHFYTLAMARAARDILSRGVDTAHDTPQTSPQGARESQERVLSTCWALVWLFAFSLTSSAEAKRVHGTSLHDTVSNCHPQGRHNGAHHGSAAGGGGSDRCRPVRVNVQWLQHMVYELIIVASLLEEGTLVQS